MYIRTATTADAPPIIRLIDSVYREYGDRLHLGDADADLADIESAYTQRSGTFVVLCDRRTICGTHAVLPLPGRPGVCTFRRLYLAPALRGHGWGEKLMDWAVEWVIARGYVRIEFWSDTRFTRAHGFFRRLGFQHDGRVRHLQDGWLPYAEYFFSRDLESLSD